MTDRERLRAIFERRTGPVREDGCRYWGRMRLQRYGQLRWKRRHRQGTHVAIYLVTGRWPRRMVAHTCDVRSCVEYEHLVEASPKWNQVDACMKGKMAKKLTPATVIRIRIGSERGRSIRQLAREFCVAAGTIRSVLRRRTWAWLP